MKKLVSLLMVTVLAVTISLSFASCGAASNTTATTTKGAEKLTMATNAEFAPYEFMEGDKVVGIDAEIAQAVAEKLGKELEIVNMNFDAIITSVSSGKYDFAMAGLTVTEDRKKNVNFSDTYAKGVQVVIVKEDSKIKSVDDLFAEGANNTVGVQISTTGDIYASGDIQDKGLGKVSKFNKGADAVVALTNGQIDCVVIDNEPAKKFVEANKGLKILDTTYAEEDYAACFAKGNTKLQEDFNKALAELKADGTIQKIIDKYISAN